MNIKPAILSALMILPTLGVAQAQGRMLERRHEIHQDLRQNRRDLRNAVRQGDWDTVRSDAHQIHRDERRLDRNRYYLQRNNNWNSYNYHRPYNRGYYYRYNSNRVYP